MQQKNTYINNADAPSIFGDRQRSGLPRCIYFRRLALIALILTMVLAACGKSAVAPVDSSQNAPGSSDVISAAATPFQLGNGVNLQPSYYDNGNVDFGWNLMQSETRIKTVRLEIEPDFVDAAKSWIRAASAAGYQIIATYHKASVLGSDDPTELRMAALWWKAHYQELQNSVQQHPEHSGDSSRLIINLMNEWGSHKISAADYALAYNQAIKIVREVYQGYIIIDIPGWGQETLTASQACLSSQPLLEDKQLVLSTHIYPGNWNQGRNHNFQATDLDDLKSTGRPCMVGEFGAGGGDCDWSGCVDYARKLGWPVLAWAWNGDGQQLNMVSPSWAVQAGATAFQTNAYFDLMYAKL